MEVGVHYYDLTKGMCSRYGRSIIDPLPGDPEAITVTTTNQPQQRVEGKVAPSKGIGCCRPPADTDPANSSTTGGVTTTNNDDDEDLFIHPRFSIMHSSVICFGFEYYFEGGIGRAPKGCTRFGSLYEYIAVAPNVQKTQDEFEAWLRVVTHGQFGFPMYSATEHNCHQFTDVAIKFLTNNECKIPALIWENVTRIVRSPLLRAFVPLSSRLVCGTLRQASKPIQSHLLEMGHGALRLRKAAELANVDALPSKVVFLFGCSSSGHVDKVLKLGLIGCVDLDTDPEPPTASETMNIKRLIIQLNQGNDAILDPKCITDALNSIGRVMDHRHSHMLMEPLNALRLLVLHDSILSYAISNPRMNTIVMRVVRDFADLPGECKVAFLRLLCNYASGPQGCKMLIADVRAQHWLYVAGAALLDVDPSITFHGACLLYNITLSTAVLSTNSVENIFNSAHSAHIDNILTVALYHLNSRRCTDAVFLRVLMAVIVLCEASPSIVSAIATHTLSPNIDELLAVYGAKAKATTTSPLTTEKSQESPQSNASETSEIRTLLCLLNSFLFIAEGGLDGDDDMLGPQHDDEANR